MDEGSGSNFGKELLKAYFYKKRSKIVPLSFKKDIIYLKKRSLKNYTNLKVLINT